ncbi:hypothetical protein CEXT_95351 [Caerostris extrusa]|uniref:Uncharacterized protein n=1 Tax=Caerostris extrusa TaxID=172846 RepID=A0AAV4XTD3_CAEEX|nr:hypothetical protein CEXT_95351 [Caerostris extrusa]
MLARMGGNVIRSPVSQITYWGCIWFLHGADCIVGFVTDADSFIAQKGFISPSILLIDFRGKWALRGNACRATGSDVLLQGRKMGATMGRS